MKDMPILILHGWNLSAAKFQPLEVELKKRGYKTYCIDLPGFGNTDKPKNPLDLSAYVRFVKDFLIKKKLDKIILIGHSFGGRISIKLTAENPKIVHALILTGTPGINPVPKGKIVFFLYLAKAGKLMFSLPVMAGIQDKARKLLYRIARATDFYNTDEKMRETFKNIIREDLVPLMKRIITPTLLIWGKDDGIVLLSIARKMSSLIKNSKLIVISEARHGVRWTHPKEFTDEVEKFLEKL